MNDSNPIWRFTLSALAVWRITHLFAKEDGPWDVIARLRAKLGNSILGRLMDCFYCLSLWVSVPMAIWLTRGWIGLFIYWQALSGAACLLERATSDPEPVFRQIEPTIQSRNRSPRRRHIMCCGQKRIALMADGQPSLLRTIPRPSSRLRNRPPVPVLAQHPSPASRPPRCRINPANPPIPADAIKSSPATPQKIN